MKILGTAAVLVLAASLARAQTDGAFSAQSAALDAAVYGAATRVQVQRMPASEAESARPLSFDEQLRGPLLERLKRNPVAAQFVVPVLEQDPSIRFEVGDAAGTDVWGSYDHVSKVVTVHRDMVNKDFAQLNGKHSGDRSWTPLAPLEAGRPLDSAQIAVLCDRYLGLVVHEVGGHARHYDDLRRLLGRDAANVYETELDSLRLEAMAVTAERIARPDYLDDGTDLGNDERGLADAFAKSFAKRDPGVFTDYVKKTLKGYDRLTAITSLSDDALRRESRGVSTQALFIERDYFRDDAKRLDAAQNDLFSNASLPEYPDDDPSWHLGRH